MDAKTRRHVRERAGHRCEYCRLPQTAAPFLRFHVEHIQASQHVRDDSLENLCLACPRCNLSKGTNLTTLNESRELVTLFHPRRQDWDEHFRLDGAVIEGLTEVGTATAKLLKMNEGDQLQIRAALVLAGEF